MNQRAYLQCLANKFGDFKVAKSWRDNNGEHHWSKHYSVMELWHSDWGLQFLEQVNHRQILLNELVLDIDENNTENAKQKCQNILEFLDQRGWRYKAYFTGSRGHHIHIFFKTQFNNKQERELFRELVIKDLGCDLAKKNENVMIAIENIPHWKTGQPKILIKNTMLEGDDFV